MFSFSANYLGQAHSCLELTRVFRAKKTTACAGNIKKKKNKNKQIKRKNEFKRRHFLFVNYAKMYFVFFYYR